jgi:hypothetical protein
VDNSGVLWKHHSGITTEDPGSIRPVGKPPPIIHTVRYVLHRSLCHATRSGEWLIPVTYPYYDYDDLRVKVNDIHLGKGKITRGSVSA